MTDRWTGRPGTEREGQGEMDRRVAGGGGQTSDGSGVWGSDAGDRGFTDYASRTMWQGVASAAEAAGLTNAARHMRHYLDNSGRTLTVNADAMLRDVLPLRQAYERQVAAARSEANRRIATLTPEQRTAGTTFTMEGSHNSDVYCRRSISADWYFAIGGFTYYYTAEVTVLPPQRGGTEPTVQMVIKLQVRDRYNWDQGKAVELAGITVRDEQLGRLHRVGLAQEYDVQGTSSARQVTWAWTGAAPAGPAGMTNPNDPLGREATTPQADSRDGARSDTDRPR